MKSRTLIRKISIIYVFCTGIVMAMFLSYLRDEHSFELLKYDLNNGFFGYTKVWKYIGGAVVFMLFFLGYVSYRLRGYIRYTWSMRIHKLTLRYGHENQVYAVWYVFIAALTIICILMGYRIRGNVSDNVFYKNIPKCIAHACGSIDDINYTNSYDALEKNYELGQRCFEVDLSLTADNILVARHDWDQNIQEGIDGEHIPTLEVFLNIPIEDKYEPMSFDNLLGFMVEHPEICIITDSKFSDEDTVSAQFAYICESIDKIGDPTLYDRIIVQLYNEEMLGYVEKFHHFSYIFTLYETWPDKTVEQFREYCRFAIDNGIRYITFNSKHISEEVIAAANEYNIKLFVHTVNNPDEAVQYLDMGIYGIYTDDILKDELEE